jgi:hypothetical protein
MVYDIQAIDAKIRLMQATAEELRQLGSQIPSIDRNVARILSSLKMLEIGISDAAEMGLV